MSKNKTEKDQDKKERGGKGRSPKSPSPSPKSEGQPKDAGKKNTSAKQKKEEESGLCESVKDIRQFLKEVVIEFQKITWPGREQIVRETITVLALVAIITAGVLAFDKLVQFAVFQKLDEFARKNNLGRS